MEILKSKAKSENGQFINARMSNHDALRYEDMTPLQKAKADMDYYRHIGGFGYKQAKKRYEKLLRKEQRCLKKASN